jgi:hypothetical protein
VSYQADSVFHSLLDHLHFFSDDPQSQSQRPRFLPLEAETPLIVEPDTALADATLFLEASLD